MNNLNKIQFWNLPESRRLEFKESFPKGDAVARTVIAFANGAGGQLVFGVKDSPREILGIPDDQLFVLEEKISNHLFDLCAPTIIPEIYIQSAEGKNLLIVEIFPGSQKPYFLKSNQGLKWILITLRTVALLYAKEIPCFLQMRLYYYLILH